MNNWIKTKKDGGMVEVMKKNLWAILLFILLIVVDLVTKVVADAYFSKADSPDSIALIPGYLEFCIAYNRGISFSIGSTAPMWAKIALIIGTGIIFVVLGILFFKMDERRVVLRIALVFVVAGGIGNFIDRVYYRVWDPATFPLGVRDMVRLKIWFMDFGVCNFADFFIVGGAIVMMLGLLFFDSMAMFPLTEKYKALAKEEEEREEAKKIAKQAKGLAVQTTMTECTQSEEKDASNEEQSS
ncbi:MAG: signal peptidase II [Clostridia bacterium]|nr:signal peptidase II [Clostridia bacterium]